MFFSGTIWYVGLHGMPCGLPHYPTLLDIIEISHGCVLHIFIISLSWWFTYAASGGNERHATSWLYAWAESAHLHLVISVIGCTLHLSTNTNVIQTWAWSVIVWIHASLTAISMVHGCHNAGCAEILTWLLYVSQAANLMVHLSWWVLTSLSVPQVP